jgi:hypothetical protein
MLPVLALVACAESDEGTLEVSPPTVEAAGLRLLVAVPEGDASRNVISVATDEMNVLGMDATLRWDPGEIRYVGQVPVPGTATVVNDSESASGRLVLTMLDPLDSSGRESVFAFEALGSVTPATVSLHVERMVTPVGVVLDIRARSPEYVDSDLANAHAKRMSWADWAPILDPRGGGGGPASRPAAAPGEGFVFGDATQDGVINVLDALYTANVSVGNTLIAECIVGTDAPSRDCIAANVRPENAPGLGEPSDSCPPGVEVCGVEGRSINVLDALAISQESVGLDPTVVGETIPGRSVIPSDSVTLSGVLTGTRSLSADTIYVLSGEVRVGDEVGASGEIAIAAGTRVIALPGARLRITRNGRIVADATQFEPVTFTCLGAPAPGCWRGLVIDGNATVNTGTPDSPTLGGRSAGGCTQTGSAGQQFGGCEDADSSGVLRFVRVQHAGFGGGAALALRGVGTGTVIEQIYVLASSGVGVSAEGGTARIKRLRVTAPGSVALEWSLGWRGALQFGVLQTLSSGTSAIRGINSGSQPDAIPRSAPVIRNVTLVGPPDPGSQSPGAGGIILEGGTDATLRSLLVLAQPLPTSHVLDVNGSPTWNRLDLGAIRFDSSLIAGYARLGALDADPATTAGYYSPDAEGQFLKDLSQWNVFIMTPARVDSVLRAPWASVPDLRPDPFGSPAALVQGCPSPPLGDPFFETAPYCGAVAPPSITTSQIPWFEPAPLYDMTPTPLAPQPGLLVVRVETSAQAPLPGVSIDGGAVTTYGITGLDGTYRSYTPAGGSVFTLDDLPPGCSSPGLIVYGGPAAGVVFFAVETLSC